MRKKINSMDILGICTSMFCLVHCLAFPFLFALGLDSLIWAIDNEWIELLLMAISLIVGGISFYGGYRSHKQHSLPVLFISGFLLLINGEAVAAAWLGILLSTAGACTIAYAHFQNQRLRQYAVVK